jgi:hypothetical protein
MPNSSGTHHSYKKLKKKGKNLKKMSKQEKRKYFMKQEKKK